MEEKRKVDTVVKVNDSYAIGYHAESHHMDFTIMEINGLSQNPETKEWDIPLYGYNIHSENFEDGEEVAHGFIKWDGCSHWYFSEYQHICGWNSGKHFSELPEAVFKIASENIPNWMDSVADYP